MQDFQIKDKTIYETISILIRYSKTLIENNLYIFVYFINSQFHEKLVYRPNLYLHIFQTQPWCYSINLAQIGYFSFKSSITDITSLFLKEYFTSTYVPLYYVLCTYTVLQRKIKLYIYLYFCVCLYLINRKLQTIVQKNQSLL